MLNQDSIKTAEQFQQELESRFPNNHIRILEYTKASGPIVYECLDCGKIYKKSRANHLYENKTLCSKCYSGKTSKVREAFLQRLELDGFELLDNPNKSIAEKFHIRCKKCGREYDYKIQMGATKKINCRFCGVGGFPIDQQTYEKRLKEAGLDDFTVLKFVNMTHSVTLSHKCGYVFSQLPENFLRSGNCPKCSPRKSSGEKRIATFLEDKKIPFEEQKKFEGNGLLSYDFFIPSRRMLIEYQGEQHYRPVKHFGGEEKFAIQQQRDLKKRRFAEENNYTLLEISYLDFNNIEKILEGSTTILEEEQDEVVRS